MDLAALVSRQHTFFRTGATRPINFRREQLRQFQAALEKHECSLLAALEKDLGKSSFQGYATELSVLHAELRQVIASLAKWSRPQRKSIPWFVRPARGWVQPEPFGVSLIFGPWNYPLQLLLVPLVSSIAAGNCSIMKPSEIASATAKAIAVLIKDVFAEEYVAVVEGDATVSGALLKNRFDKIFFTGSTRVGRLVMQAAAAHLTPLTLELGGKCPAIVCHDANITLAAKRIAWGKFMNAGQTCVAPDFVLVDQRVESQFQTALARAVRNLYGENPRASSDYGRIISEPHFNRLVHFLSDGNILFGGEQDLSERYLAPTVLTGVSPASAVMQEEIFGPILPVLSFRARADVYDLLAARPVPLALYLFTTNQSSQREMLQRLRSGGACVNDVVSQILCSKLPFGGLGQSGFGSYHGKAGFDAFSHQRAVLKRATWLDLAFRYPPQKGSLTTLKRALRVLLRD